MKSLKAELVVAIGGLVLAVSILIGASATLVASNAMRQMTTDMLEVSAKDAAVIIGGIAGKELEVLKQVAAQARLANPASSDADNLSVLNEAQQRNGYIRIFFISPDGKAVYYDGATADLSSRAYFKWLCKEPQTFQIPY